MAATTFTIDELPGVTFTADIENGSLVVTGQQTVEGTSGSTTTTIIQLTGLLP